MKRPVAYIAGTGRGIPAKVMTNHDFAAIGIETDHDWIVERTGIVERHIGRPDETTTSMAATASRAAMQRAGVQPGEIDAIVLSTATPDRLLPSTAVDLQAELGATRAAGFDISAACSGWVYGMTVAEGLIASGVIETALVVGAEKMSAIVDWKDRATCVLFGDGAGAVVLEASDKPGILATELHADGRYVDILCVPGHVSGGKVLGDPLLKMDGPAVFKLAVGVLEQVAREVLAKSDRTASDIDWLIPHQANIRIMQGTAKKLGLPLQKMVVTVDQHGNTSAASIPLALDQAMRDGRIKPGQTVLMEGVGGGFTWGAALARM